MPTSFFATRSCSTRVPLRNSCKPGAAPLLRACRERLAGVEPFETGPLEHVLQGFIADQGIKPADIVHALRVAVTGKSVGPGLYDCLALLGRQAVLARIDRALARIY